MNTKAALISRQCQLREWAAMVQDCQNRPAGMGVAEWCANHSITAANYYYRMTEEKKACLNAVPAQVIEQAVVPVPTELMKPGGSLWMKSRKPEIQIH